VQRLEEWPNVLGFHRGDLASGVHHVVQEFARQALASALASAGGGTQLRNQPNE